MIIHIDMDAFFASIEQAINPRLRGKPLIVGSRGNPLYTVVCAASYEAKALGIHSGMASRDAFRCCPGLKFVAADQSKYIWTSEQILEMLKGYGFPLNYASIDEFQLDLEDYPDPVAVAVKASTQIYANFNITASIGIAKNWLLAKLASKLKKPRGLLMITDDNVEAVLRAAPLDKLCGMGGKTGTALAVSGIRTCWDLYLKLPAFFSPSTALRAGQNPGKFKETPETPKSVGHSYTLSRATVNPQVIRSWVRLLSEMVAFRLRQQQLSGRTVHLWLNGPELGSYGAQKRFPDPVADGREIAQMALKIRPDLAQNPPKVRALGVTVSSLCRPQEQLYFGNHVSRQALNRALDRINSRFGEEAIYWAITGKKSRELF